VVCDWIAESRVRLEQLRLLVLKTAWLMDTVGNKGAHTEIQVIKIATPATVQRVLGKAIQVHGAGGLSQDFPLANAYANIGGLRFADGPTRSTRTRWRTVRCAVRPRLTDRR
jgi:acyl-CoA dehydrogenase